MKKVITTTLIQSIAFVLIYNTLGYFFNHVKGNFFEYFKSQTFKNLFFLILMFVVFFIGNYISKDKEITWKDIFKKNKK
jgi:Kef-type K+ transport system membrane component KefB